MCHLTFKPFSVLVLLRISQPQDNLKHRIELYKKATDGKLLKIVVLKHRVFSEAIIEKLSAHIAELINKLHFKF